MHFRVFHNEVAYQAGFYDQPYQMPLKNQLITAYIFVSCLMMRVSHFVP